ncbi:MAG: M67 family peptidase, partial [Lysobacteraceae bacterium]
MCDAAKSTPDVEVCGMIFGTSDRVMDVAQCVNVAADPRRTFELDPTALFAALRAERGGGPALLGYWHSHPSGDVRPSVTDAARAAADGKVWLIACDDQPDLAIRR